VEGEIGETHDPETHLIPLVIQAARGDHPEFSIFGTDYDTPDGTAIRDFVHVDDLAQAHVLAIRHLIDGGEGGAFNLGTGLGHSVREVIAAVERHSGLGVPVHERSRRSGDPGRLVAGAERAHKILDWKPVHDLDSIIATALAWDARKSSVGRPVLRQERP
jgi:UDP-glucose 4-epimerase